MGTEGRETQARSPFKISVDVPPLSLNPFGPYMCVLQFNAFFLTLSSTVQRSIRVPSVPSLLFSDPPLSFKFRGSSSCSSMLSKLSFTHASLPRLTNC